MIGEFAALSAAFLWATATVIFHRVGVKIPPLRLNLYKGAIAIFFIGITLWAIGPDLPQLTPVPASLILLSGSIGIGLGDTAFFNALNTLGARRVLLLETLSPPLVAVLASIFLNEQLGIIACGGILLTLLGVAWVISERTVQPAFQTLKLKRGLGWGFLAILGQASAAVLSRAALAGTNISPLWSSLLRLSAGVAIALLLLLVKRLRKDKTLSVLPDLSPLMRDRLLQKDSLILVGTVIFVSFFGTFLAIWLQQTAFKFSPAATAQTLMATSPLFILPLTAMMGEKVSGRAVLGVLVAIAGIRLLFR